ncbi:transglycosylase SLT domain-containing protein [Myxococcota bacterium]|nr:transglycosylase SLT domain-containing protein [Myxococcota bacterium]MBU1896317.1 transglycosylase SLT domain-containing protein [Myxococcota bacterium]
MTLLLLLALLAPPRPALTPIKLGQDDALRAEIALKRWRRAADQITQRTPHARFVRGWLLSQAGEDAEAARALAGLEAKLPLLKGMIREISGQALLNTGDYARALERVEGVEGWPALRVRARALRELGRLDEARAAYQGLIDSGQASEIHVGLLGLARLEFDRGGFEAALTLLLRLDQEHPTRWTAKEGRALVKALLLRRPQLALRWTARGAEAWIERAERLAKRHWSETVVDSLTPLLDEELDDALTCRHRYELGRALRKLRRWKEGTPHLKVAVEACQRAGATLAPWALYLYGQAAERMGDEDAASASHRALLERHPSHRLSDDAGYFETRHLIEDRQDLKGAWAWVKALVASHPQGDMVPDAVFFVAQSMILAKRYKDAREVLSLDDQLVRDFSHRDGGRALYWRARLDQLQGRRRAAISGFEATITSAPLGWYALLAYSRLCDLAGVKAARRYTLDALKAHSAYGPQWPQGGGPVPEALQGEALDRARLLARLGLPQPTQRALKQAMAGHEGLELISAVILDAAGMHPISHNILRRQRPEFRFLAPLSDVGRPYWRIAYPTPFKPAVEAAATAAGVDPRFVWGVIREESGFAPAAESFANAVGLMQLILPTGQQMAEPGEGRITKARLTIPALNIKLGARFLAYVQETTSCNPALIPAGYNAGAGALKRWMKARGDLPLDLFVETIPYEEARGYVKRVIASWATYTLLYGPQQADPLLRLSMKVKVKKPKKAKPKAAKGKATKGKKAPPKKAKKAPPKKASPKKTKPKKAKPKKTKPKSDAVKKK